MSEKDKIFWAVWVFGLLALTCIGMLYGSQAAVLPAFLGGMAFQRLEHLIR